MIPIDRETMKVFSAHMARRLPQPKRSVVDTPKLDEIEEEPVEEKSEE